MEYEILLNASEASASSAETRETEQSEVYTQIQKQVLTYIVYLLILIKGPYTQNILSKS